MPDVQSEWMCLTVLVPETLEERVVDWLLAHPDWPVEFSIHPVAARGPLVHLAQVEERVQGHARRVELKMIVPQARLDALVAAVTGLLDGADGGYWVLPVARFASFRGSEVPA